MNHQEFSKIMAFISAAINKPIARATMEAYFEMLSDIPFDLARAAVKKIIGTDEYPVLPTIGKIRNAAIELSGGDKITAAEAWGLVLNAIKKYGYYNEEKALKSMPAEAAQVAKWMGWREICMSENTDVLRGQFMRIFEAEQKRRQDLYVLLQQSENLLSKPAERLKGG